MGYTELQKQETCVSVLEQLAPGRLSGASCRGSATAHFARGVAIMGTGELWVTPAVGARAALPGAGCAAAVYQCALSSPVPAEGASRCGWPAGARRITALGKSLFRTSSLPLFKGVNEPAHNRLLGSK